MLDLFESRHRTAVEILGAAYKEKTGRKLELKNADYVHHLFMSLRNSITELSNSSKYKYYFSDFDFRLVNWNAAAAHVEKLLAEKPLFSYVSSSEQVIFRKDFLDQLDIDVSLTQMLNESGRYLGTKLAEVPVGISYRVAELTSTVRFGDFQFYGSWLDYTSTARNAYLRKGQELGGVMEVELRISSTKKN